MILVDSSVWIDYFRGDSTAGADRLHALIPSDDLRVGDLIVAEVLQGFPNQRDFDRAEELLSRVTCLRIPSWQVAVQSAMNYRNLRTLGITVRKTIDVLIATRCIMSGFELLHNDRDFDPFVKHLGLKSVL